MNAKLYDFEEAKAHRRGERLIGEITDALTQCEYLHAIKQPFEPHPAVLEFLGLSGIECAVVDGTLVALVPHDIQMMREMKARLAANVAALEAGDGDA